MAIVRSKNKKTGITYVYESESYWDPEKKQPRNRRKLIGKLDDDGNIVPTGKRGRKKTEPTPVLDEKEAAGMQENLEAAWNRCRELETEKVLLEEKIRKLETEKTALVSELTKLIERYR